MFVRGRAGTFDAFVARFTKYVFTSCELRSYASAIQLNYPNKRHIKALKPDKTMDRTDVEIDEYEEIVGDLGRRSDRAETEEARAMSIQEPMHSRKSDDTHRAIAPETSTRESGRQFNRVASGGRRTSVTRPCFTTQ